METETTRDRILTVAMRLFGEQGYAATTIAQVEGAAGLSAGSGALYRHFSSKQELFAAGVQTQLRTAAELRALLSAEAGALADLPMADRLDRVFRAAIARLENGRDLIRMLLRDYRAFPDLLARVREDQMSQVGVALAGWLSAQPELRGVELDWPAVSGILIAAVSHYWFLGDAFGVDPFGLEKDRYLAALTDLTMRALTPGEADGA